MCVFCVSRGIKVIYNNQISSRRRGERVCALCSCAGAAATRSAGARVPTFFARRADGAADKHARVDGQLHYRAAAIQPNRIK